MNCNDTSSVITLSQKVVEKFTQKCYPKSIQECSKLNCIFYSDKDEKRISYKNVKIPIKKMAFIIYYSYNNMDILKKRIINICTNRNCLNPLHLKLITKMSDDCNLQNDTDNISPNIHNTFKDTNNSDYYDNNDDKIKKRRRLSKDEYIKINELLKKYTPTDEKENTDNFQILANEQEIIDYCKSKNINERCIKRIIKKNTYSFFNKIEDKKQLSDNVTS
jgi:hypothetical protein